MPGIPIAGGLGAPPVTQSPDLLRESTNVKERAFQSLMLAGADVGQGSQLAAIINSNPGVAEILASHPELSHEYARRFPASSSPADYYRLEEQAGFTSRALGIEGAQGNDAQAIQGSLSPAVLGAAAYGPPQGAFHNRELGITIHPKRGIAIQDNGPGQQTVVYSPDSKALGSPHYLKQVQKWSPKQVKQWAKRLVPYGANPKGPVDQKFLAAMQMYWNDKYLGNPIPDSSASGMAAPAAAQLDMVKVHALIHQQFLNSFGTPPTKTELTDWGKWFKDKFHELVKQGQDPSNAESGTQQRFLNRSGIQDVADRNYENTRVQDALSAGAQAFGSLF